MGLGHGQMRARLKASITGPSRTEKVPSKETIGQPKVITALEDEHLKFWLTKTCHLWSTQQSLLNY